MQFPRDEKPAIGIAFDSDLGNDIDDVLTLGLLYGFDTKRPPEARLISTSLTQSTLKAAGFCEVVDRFYTTITNREIPERFRRNNPAAIGLALNGKMANDTPLITEPLAKRDAEGNLVYHHEIEKVTDTADSAALIRNAFTAQYDQNALAVLTGPATNFAAVLGLRGAKELIESKVRLMTVAAGVYPEVGHSANSFFAAAISALMAGSGPPSG